MKRCTLKEEKRSQAAYNRTLIRQWRISPGNNDVSAKEPRRVPIRLTIRARKENSSKRTNKQGKTKERQKEIKVWSQNLQGINPQRKPGKRLLTRSNPNQQERRQNVPTWSSCMLTTLVCWPNTRTIFGGKQKRQMQSWFIQFQDEWATPLSDNFSMERFVPFSQGLGGLTYFLHQPESRTATQSLIRCMRCQGSYISSVVRRRDRTTSSRHKGTEVIHEWVTANECVNCVPACMTGVWRAYHTMLLMVEVTLMNGEGRCDLSGVSTMTYMCDLTQMSSATIQKTGTDLISLITSLTFIVSMSSVVSLSWLTEEWSSCLMTHRRSLFSKKTQIFHVLRWTKLSKELTSTLNQSK